MVQPELPNLQTLRGTMVSTRSGLRPPLLETQQGVLPTMMTKSFRDDWVYALTSGMYEQGQGTLSGDGKQCCLGVRCILDVARGKMQAFAKVIGNGLGVQMSFGQSELGASTTLPRVEDSDRWGLDAGLANYLAQMNDSGKTFLEIAEFLRAMPVVDDFTGYDPEKLKKVPYSAFFVSGVYAPDQLRDSGEWVTIVNVAMGE